MEETNEFVAVAETAKKRLSAMMDGDVNQLDGLLHTGLIYIHSSARVDGKASFISSIAAGDLDYHGFLATDIDFLKVAPGVVICTGVLETSVTARGRKLTLDNRFIETWLLQDGAWRMISWQSTPRPQAAS